MTIPIQRPASIAALVCAIFMASCAEPPRTVLVGLLESRRLSAEMLAQFEKGLEAGNRAVMADTDEVSAAAVREVRQATQTLQSDSKTLADILTRLDYSAERTALQEFSSRLEELNALDREILDLAALDTNIKAQKLSFGTAQEAATRFTTALEPLRSGHDAPAHAIASDAVAAMRAIQTLEAPHIAEPQDAVMDRIEQQMRIEEATVRKSLAALSTMANGLAAARKASQEFDAFMGTHAEILKLSRHNSNVRSLALSLGKKRALAAACEERLVALQQMLANRDISSATR